MTDPKKPAIKMTAEEAYVRAHMRAAELLDAISDRLQDLPAPGNDDRPIHWGHVGDLDHVHALLKQITDFLDGRE
jgi:hypothetical protein